VERVVEWYVREKQGVLSILPKISEISVGSQMERPVSVLSDRNIRDHLWRWSNLTICRSILPNRFISHLLFSRFHLSGGFGKGVENGGNHSSRLARFDRKMFHFPRIVTLVSDRSVWHNGKHPRCGTIIREYEDRNGVQRDGRVGWYKLGGEG